MNEIPVYISGEDEVTKAIIERLLSYCSPKFTVLKSIPARGGQIKSKISELNNLSKVRPVIMLTDLDATDCAPTLKKALLKDMVQNKNFLINIAVDEGEAWLMADRKGFAEFLEVDEDVIPNSTMQKMGGRKALVEMDFSAKSSWILTHSIALKSRNVELRAQVGAQGKASKGPEYNVAILPFVKNIWNIDEAMKNSDSLSRMVLRLKRLSEQVA